MVLIAAMTWCRDACGTPLCFESSAKATTLRPGTGREAGRDPKTGTVLGTWAGQVPSLLLPWLGDLELQAEVELGFAFAASRAAAGP